MVAGFALRRRSETLPACLNGASWTYEAEREGLERLCLGLAQVHMPAVVLFSARLALCTMPYVADEGTGCEASAQDMLAHCWKRYLAKTDPGPIDAVGEAHSRRGMCAGTLGLGHMRPRAPPGVLARGSTGRSTP